jgi:uncharacterized protein YcnI
LKSAAAKLANPTPWKSTATPLLSMEYVRLRYSRDYDTLIRIPSGERRMMNSRSLLRQTVILAGLTTACVSLVCAHIRIAPTESVPGAREKYTMRVPNEKKVNSTKVVGEFPEGLDIYDFEFKPGWNIEFKKNDSGKIVGATWTGTLRPYEFIEFGMLGINPKEERDLVWRFVQYYEDGTTEEFTGPLGSRLPSPVTKLKKPGDALTTSSK